ncbi:MAG: helix-turn-helix transcriptional regulator [Sneathiella sp.]|nr:helix-turn-helix transcriptional regulator [Sneathiella sp.]
MNTAITTAIQLGALIREKRKSLKMTQRELALAIDVGERFIVDLEKGKESCQLELSLRAAKAVGIRLMDEKTARKLPPSGGYDLSVLK